MVLAEPTEEIPKEKAESLTPEEQDNETRKIVEMQYKAGMQMIQYWLQNFCTKMITTNKVSYNQKIQNMNAMVNAILAGIDVGVDVVNPKLLESGLLAKEQAHFGATFAKMIELKMLWLSLNQKQKEKEENERSKEESKEHHTT